MNNKLISAHAYAIIWHFYINTSTTNFALIKLINKITVSILNIKIDVFSRIYELFCFCFFFLFSSFAHKHSYYIYFSLSHLSPLSSLSLSFNFNHSFWIERSKFLTIFPMTLSNLGGKHSFVSLRKLLYPPPPLNGVWPLCERERLKIILTPFKVHLFQVSLFCLISRSRE